jgi:hypothetical protein
LASIEFEQIRRRVPCYAVVGVAFCGHR